MEIRRLKTEDFDAFYHMRILMYETFGEIDEKADPEKMEKATRDYYIHHIGDDFFSWGVFVENNITSIASLCLFNRLPYPGNLEGKEGHVLGVFTLPEFRNKGMAQALTNTILDHSRENGIKRLWLKNSEAGKFVYEKCGFVEKKNEMEWHCE